MDSQNQVEKEGHVRALISQEIADMAVGTLPPTLGSRVRVWKQDPSVASIGVREAYIHGTVHAGPRDSQITITGLPLVEPDEKGDFLFLPSDPIPFDAVHTYTVVRQTLTMYQRMLEQKLPWQWETDGAQQPISVYPHAASGLNAYYSRSERALKFFFQTNAGPEESIYVCRSLDVVAHETGHAILDTLKPRWIYSSRPQTGGLHEAFGDLTAILLVLAQLDQVEHIVAETKADLHHKTILSSLAEQFGEVIGRDSGLRNADNDLTLSEVSNEVHSISQVFTGALYDILADLFSLSRNPRHIDDAVVLYNAGRLMGSLLMLGITSAADEDATFAEVANGIMTAAEETAPEAVPLCRKHFQAREILGGTAAAAPVGTASYSHCCGTMRSREYRDTDPSR